MPIHQPTYTDIEFDRQVDTLKTRMENGLNNYEDLALIGKVEYADNWYTVTTHPACGVNAQRMFIIQPNTLGLSSEI